MSRRFRTVRRLGGQVVGLVLAAAPPSPLTAQVTIQPSIGLRYSTTIVHDSIVAPFDLRPAMAPALAITATSRTAAPWAAQATFDLSTSTLQRHDAGATADLGRVSTLAVTVGVQRRLPAGLAAAARVGGLKYLPADDTGIFRSGTGGVLALAGAALSYAPPGAVAGPWRIGAARDRQLGQRVLVWGAYRDDRPRFHESRRDRRGGQRPGCPSRSRGSRLRLQRGDVGAVDRREQPFHRVIPRAAGGPAGFHAGPGRRVSTAYHDPRDGPRPRSVPA